MCINSLVWNMKASESIGQKYYIPVRSCVVFLNLCCRGRTRLPFTLGDASLTIWQLKSQDAGMYVCKVSGVNGTEQIITELIVDSSAAPGTFV